MVRLNLNFDDIIEDLYQRYQDGSFTLDEQGVRFLLGYHLVQNRSSAVGFEIGLFGRLEAGFSPDLDVLSVEDDLRGFEVKGYRSDNRKISKGQLYRGLGQAVTLLNQPVAADGGALRYVSLAYPETNEFNSENWRWKEAFVESLRETPIGLVNVNRDGIETVVEPDENPLYNSEWKSELLVALRDQAKGSDQRHPDRGLQNLALKIVKDKELI